LYEPVHQPIMVSPTFSILIFYSFVTKVSSAEDYDPITHIMGSFYLFHPSSHALHASFVHAFDWVDHTKANEVNDREGEKEVSGVGDWGPTIGG